VVGIGLGTELALNGAVAHAFADILFKGLLFMSMGAVLFRVGTVKGSELGGLYKSMPWTAGFCLVGAASISAFPLFSGFVTKSMVIAAAMEQGYFWTWLVLLFASAGVFHHAGIKIPYFAFFAHDSGKRCQEAPAHMLAAMAIAAALCIGIGCFPGLFYSLLPFDVDFHPYSLDHVVAQVQLLFLSALAFTLLMRTGIYPPELRSTNLDFDWVYRRLGRDAALSIGRWASLVWDAATARGSNAARQLAGTVERYHAPQGILARAWPTGIMAFWTTVILAAYLVLSYL
jgi:multicomponent Na+:H+ antiporter subunit D